MWATPLLRIHDRLSFRMTRGRVTSAVAPPSWPRAAALAHGERRFVETGIEFSVGAPSAGAGARLVDLPCPAST
jgi:hypothetical protein